MTILTFLFLICLSVLILSVSMERRRFRNAFYLLNTLILLALNIPLWFGDSPIGEVLVFLVFLFFIFLVGIVPFLLVIDGVFMIAHEGFRISNLLSLCFGIFILFGEFSTLNMFLGSYNTGGTVIEVANMNWSMFFSLTVIYVSVVFLSFMFYTFFMQLIPKRTDFDYIIIHGCGLLNGNQVSKLLQSRIDKAITVYNKSISDAKFICSGGKGADETLSEAQAMKFYLLEHGIDQKDILMEDSSTNTRQNLINSKKIIEERGGRQLVALVTSNYHVLRCLLYSKKIKLNCTGVGAKTALYYWPSAMIREFIALMKEHIWLFAIGLALIALFSFTFQYL